jgi:hypothetical protein
MLNLLKKFTILILCAGLLTIGAVPSMHLLANDSDVKKEAQSTQNSTKETAEEENPTLTQTWQKITKGEWKSLNRADALNIGKSVIGCVGIFATAYIIYKYKLETPVNTNKPPFDTPDNQMPNVLSDIVKNDQYGPEYAKKIADLSNADYMKQLENKGLINLKKQLEKEIQEKSDPNNIDTIKKLIDRRHKTLQKHLKKGNITSKPTSKTDTSIQDKEPEKPKTLYPRAEKSLRWNVKVVKQRGASCGYHAFLNSVLSLHDINEDQANDIINTKFAQQDGSWRASIIQLRKKELVKNYLKRILPTCMYLETEEEQNAWDTAKAEWQDKLDGSFGFLYSLFACAPEKPAKKLNPDEKSALNWMANAYASAFAANETLNILQENPIDLEEQIQHLVNQYIPSISQNNKLAITKFIQKIDFTELTSDIANATDLIKTAQRAAFGSNIETDLFGDNLVTDEMEILKPIILKEYAIEYDAITIIDNTYLLNTDAYQAILTPAKNQMLQHNCKHSFCIRLSDNMYNEKELEELNEVIADKNATQEEKDKAELMRDTITRRLAADTGSTHWISVTLDRVHGNNTYSVKDSMGNDFTNHVVVKQLIEALEQPYTPQKNTSLEKELLDAITAFDAAENKSSSQEKKTSSSNKSQANKTAVLVPSANPGKVASIQTRIQTGSSCAYHALKNADDIIRILQKPQIKTMESNFNFEEIATLIGNNISGIKSEQKVATLFDEDNNSGEWRELIKTRRLQPVLKESIYQKLLRSIPCSNYQTTEYDNQKLAYENKKSDWEKGDQEYRKTHKKPIMPKLPLSDTIDLMIETCFKNIANACATQLINTKVAINLSEGVDLQKTFITDVMGTHKPSYLENTGEERHNICISFLNIDMLRENFGQEITQESALKNADTRELRGNDLDAEELEILLQHDTVIKAGDISVIDRLETSNFVTQNAHAFSEVLPSVQTKMRNDNCMHAFVIRQGFSSGIAEHIQANNGTHWISVILYRVQGKNHYIIADSLSDNKKATALNKNDRSNDPDVTYLIAHLES